MLLLVSGKTQGAGVIINWNSDVGSTFLTQNGTSTLNGSFTFALGTFAPGFTPTAVNYDLWKDNFRQIDVATTSNDGFLPFNGLYSRSVSVLDNTAPYEVGNQGYLWVYNSQTLSPSSEWLLLTNDSSDGNSVDNWVIPEAPGNQTILPKNWVVRDTGVPNTYKVIWGGATDGQAPDPGTFTPPPGSFVLQTHSLPVPEPGGISLLALGGAAFLRRRRGRASVGECSLV